MDDPAEVSPNCGATSESSEYSDVTLAIQDAAMAHSKVRLSPDAALQALQSKLQTLIK